MTTLLESGLKRRTVVEIRRVLVEFDTLLSAEEVASILRISNTTARTYLRRMAERGEVFEHRVSEGSRDIAAWRALRPDEAH